VGNPFLDVILAVVCVWFKPKAKTKGRRDQDLWSLIADQVCLWPLLYKKIANWWSIVWKWLGVHVLYW